MLERRPKPQVAQTTHHPKLELNLTTSWPRAAALPLGFGPLVTLGQGEAEKGLLSSKFLVISFHLLSLNMGHKFGCR